MRSFAERLRAALLGARREGARGYGTASARRSDGYEFAELRGYVEGDDPRRIDWAATARAGSVQTRVMLEERSLSLAVALDASLSMQVGRSRSGYDLACAAAALWYGAATDDDRCARIGARPLLLAHASGRRAAAFCAGEREAPGLPFEGSLRLALAVLPRGTRLLIASDFFELDALAPLLRACGTRFDCTALLLRDPWYAGLPLGGFVRLRDAETGALARIFVGARARALYRAAVARREEAVLALLRRSGCRGGVLGEEIAPERAFALAFGIA